MKFSPQTDFGSKFVKIVVLSEINITMTTINEKSLKSIKLRVRPTAGKPTPGTKFWKFK